MSGRAGYGLRGRYSSALSLRMSGNDRAPQMLDLEVDFNQGAGSVLIGVQTAAAIDADI